MKSIVYPICIGIGTLALALPAWAAQEKSTTSAKTKVSARIVPSAQAASAANVRVSAARTTPIAQAASAKNVRASAAVKSRPSVSAAAFHPAAAASAHQRGTGARAKIGPAP